MGDFKYPDRNCMNIKERYYLIMKAIEAIASKLPSIRPNQSSALLLNLQYKKRKRLAKTKIFDLANLKFKQKELDAFIFDPATINQTVINLTASKKIAKTIIGVLHNIYPILSGYDNYDANVELSKSEMYNISLDVKIAVESVLPCKQVFTISDKELTQKYKNNQIIIEYTFYNNYLNLKGVKDKLLESAIAEMIYTMRSDQKLDWKIDRWSNRGTITLNNHDNLLEAEIAENAITVHQALMGDRFSALDQFLHP